ncbi:MAG: PAS domain S-box protein, partial [Solirubrobacterales bacterium]|nr:PAS domain S-box protein [Solirubrobacterales bacterium]
MVLNAGLLWYFARWLDRGETARRRAEQELRTSARHFELSRDLHCTAGFDGYFQHLNAAWTDTLGWSRSELRSRPFLEFVHPDDRAKTERESAGLARGGQTIDFVNRYATKDGDWRWIDWRAMADPEDELIYASARDVTASKRSSLALVASERQTREILETAYDAYISIDESGLVSGWNPQAEATFGWTCEEALGRELAELIIPEGSRDAHRRGLQRFIATGQPRVLGKRLELPGLRRDGGEFPVELTISALSTDHGYVFHAFLRDISERRRAEEELALARDQALEASRMKSMFVANVSHEIRTPMNGVIGMSELLLDSGLTEEQRELADTISSSGEALLVILDDILDISKIEAGRLELDLADFNPRDAIERACGILAPRAHTKGLELLVAIDPEVPALIHGDGARLRQVIGNFVSNAIKFTAEGEVVVNVSLRPADDGAELLRLSVSDNGIGIDRHALEQLFKPFSQADGSTTRKYGGTGLGLAISRLLLELMGGRVGADSRPGEGSCFWLELPLAAVPGTPPRYQETHELAGLRVLLVDDNAASRTLLGQQLSAWQVTCEGAQDAAHAMALLQAGATSAGPYALALIDVGMPGVDGNELARSIRAQAALRDIRLVMLTSPGGPFEVDEDAE